MVWAETLQMRDLNEEEIKGNVNEQRNFIKCKAQELA